MAQGFSLKDQLFNAEKVGYLAGLFDGPEFDGAGFRDRVMERLPELELKQRIDWIAACLSDTLPGELPQVAAAILHALPPPLDPTLSDNDFGDFIFAPLGEWVALVGIEHPDLALDLLVELTQRFSMEWAIRPFLNRWPDLVLARMRDWCDHDSYHVRRLVSEGTRPRLPWGTGIALPLDAGLPLLDRLHADPTRYVTRSVANHLNDISKKDPDLVLDRLADWHGRGRQKAAERDWIAAHALRGLVKAGHPGAMSMLGYDPEAPVTVTLELPDRARIGAELTLGVVLEGQADLPVLVDYILHFRRPGGRVSARVHKLKQAQLTGGRLRLEKRHRLKGDATTFSLVPGPHRVDVQVNGRLRATGVFDLEG